MKMSCAFVVNANIGYISGIIIILPKDVKPNNWMAKRIKNKKEEWLEVRLEDDSNKRHLWVLIYNVAL